MLAEFREFANQQREHNQKMLDRLTAIETLMKAGGGIPHQE